MPTNWKDILPKELCYSNLSHYTLVTVSYKNKTFKIEQNVGRAEEEKMNKGNKTRKKIGLQRED